MNLFSENLPTSSYSMSISAYLKKWKPNDSAIIFMKNARIKSRDLGEFFFGVQAYFQSLRIFRSKELERLILSECNVLIKHTEPLLMGIL